MKGTNIIAPGNIYVSMQSKDRYERWYNKCVFRRVILTEKMATISKLISLANVPPIAKDYFVTVYKTRFR